MNGHITESTVYAKTPMQTFMATKHLAKEKQEKQLNQLSLVTI